MSIRFAHPLSAEARAALEALAGVPHAADGKVFLFHTPVHRISKWELKKIVNLAGQGMQVRHPLDEDAIVELSDGSRHQRQADLRWRKL